LLIAQQLMFDSNYERVIDMIFYLLAVVIIAICLIIFYLRPQPPRVFATQIHYGISITEKQSFTEAANRCKKDNSPISNEPFHNLFLEGSNIVNNESFNISDSIESGRSEYNVL